MPIIIDDTQKKEINKLLEDIDNSLFNSLEKSVFSENFDSGDHINKKKITSAIVKLKKIFK